MARGLSLPVGVDKSGGAKIVEGDVNDTKIIATALSDNDSENAFQQALGLGSEMIFDVDSPNLRALILRRIKTMFDDFFRLHRYKLLTNTIRWDQNPEEATLRLTFKYLNIESDEIRTFDRTFSANQ